MNKIINLRRDKSNISDSTSNNEKTILDKFIDAELEPVDLEGVKPLNQKHKEEMEILSIMQKVVDRQKFIDLVQETTKQKTPSFVGENVFLFNGFYFRSGITALLVLLGAISIFLSSVIEGDKNYEFQCINSIPPITIQKGITKLDILHQIIVPQTMKKNGLSFYVEKNLEKPKKNNGFEKFAAGNEVETNESFNLIENRSASLIKNNDLERNLKIYTNENQNYSRNDKNLLAINNERKKLNVTKFFSTKSKSHRKFFSNSSFLGELEKTKDVLADITPSFNEKDLAICKTNPSFKRALIYESLKDSKKAEKEYLNAIEIDPNNLHIYYKAASFLESLGKYNKSEKIFTALLKQDPTNINAYRRRAYLLTKNHKYLRAEKDYTKLIELEPNNYAHYELRGHYYKYVKNYARAEKDYTALINIDPNDLRTFRSRALFYKTTNQKDKEALDMTKYYSFMGLSRVFATTSEIFVPISFIED